jgi:hypothetical protein
VDWKSNPYAGEEVLEWWRRVAFVKEFYSLDASNRQQFCQTAAADYYILDAAVRSPTEPVALQWQNWVLISCP